MLETYTCIQSKIFIFNEGYFYSILLFLCSAKKNTQEHYFKQRVAKNFFQDNFHLLLINCVMV